jgi:phosphonatase-like hydrolase
MTTAIKLMIFDMAGTTVEDEGQVPAAFNAALAECGVKLTEEQLANVRGASKREAVAELVANHAGPAWQGRAEAVYQSFVHKLEAEFAKGIQCIEGAESTFEWLRARSVKIALTTGFDRDIATLLINALGWRKYADAFVCGDDVSKGRPWPYMIFRAMEMAGTESVHEVGVAGDTVLDLQAGHNAGATLNIGVLSGAHARAKLVAQPHTHIIASVAALPAVITVR